MQAKTVCSVLSRRHFLAGSVAFAAFKTLFALDVDWAAPRGRERNLLAGACSPEKLKRALIPQDKYRPFPTIHDRAPGRVCSRRPGPPSLLVGRNISATNGLTCRPRSFWNTPVTVTGPATRVSATLACGRYRLLSLPSASKIKVAFLTTSPTVSIRKTRSFQ
jgi:hypothetical protein